jgi:RimJ/RimL family protein N-acetyltransferase
MNIGTNLPLDMKNAFLVGETIYLRPLDESDLNATYQSWFNDAEVCTFNEHHRFPMHVEDLRGYFDTTVRSKNHLILAIADKATDTHIGNISLQNIDWVNRSAEFAIIVGDKAHWGKGVATQAGKRIIDHGFSALNLHRIHCGTSADNVPMQKLAAVLGFVQEGVQRDAMWKDGKYRDVVTFGILSHGEQA